MTTIIFLDILSVLILVHELGHFLAARKNGVRVEKFCLGFGPELLKKKNKGTEYCLSLIPLGGFVKMAGDSLEDFSGRSDEYYAKTPRERFWIIFCGPLLNYLLGFLFFWLIFFTGYPALTAKVGGLIDGFGAKEAGLQAQDKIMAVDGKKVFSWEELQEIVQEKKEPSVVKLDISRSNKTFSVSVVIKDKQLDDVFGQRHRVGLLGITPFDEFQITRHGFLKSLSLAIDKTFALTVITYKGLWGLATGRMSMRESMTGPLGIFDITSKVAKRGLSAVMHLVAILSVSLALFNLLPFTVLDGGHILFLALEKLRGKTLSIKAENVITKIGLTLILTLVVLVTYNDIVRLFGDRIAKILK